LKKLRAFSLSLLGACGMPGQGYRIAKSGQNTGLGA
jgi:hypothetical protein